MKYLYENVDWNEVRKSYLNLRSLSETKRKFNLGEITLKRFLVNEGIYDPDRKQKAVVNKTPFKIGDKFHRWTIIGNYEIKDRRYVIPVQCDCGTISKTRLTWLINGKTTGCRSCASKVNYPSNRKLRTNFININGLSNAWLTSIVRNSDRGFVVQRKLNVEITLSDLYDQLVKQDFKCALTGDNLIVLDVPKSRSNASVDRISSDLGYTIDNIQWITKDVNLMKNKYDQNYFIKTCIKISKFKHGNPDPSISLND